MSALAIGSMVPDLPLFFPVVSYWQTHDFRYVLTLCLPLGLGAYTLFHLFLKVPLLSLTPRFLIKRVAEYGRPGLGSSPRLWLFVATAIAIGAYSHVLWDSFTHAGRWGTNAFPALNQTVSVVGRSMAVYKVLQHVSSVGGLLILAVVILSALKTCNPVGGVSCPAEAPLPIKYLAALLVGAVPMVSFCYLMQLDFTIAEVVGLTIRLSGSILALALAGYSLAYHVASGYRLVES